MNVLRTLKLSYRLSALIAVFALGALVYGYWSFRTLEALKVNGPLYGEIVAAKDIIADALPPQLFIIESYLVSLQMAGAAGAPARDALAARLQRLRAEHAARMRYWREQRVDPALAAMLEQQVAPPALAFYDTAFGTLLPALNAGDAAVRAGALLRMEQSYEQHRVAVDALVQRAAANARLAEADAARDIDAATTRMLLILCASLGVGVAAAVLITRSITGPLAAAVRVAQRVAAGDMRASTQKAYPDEPGLLLCALERMRASLAATLAERSAAELSLRRAKELTERLIDSANVMIVGLGRRGEVLIFNETARRMTGYADADVIGRVWRELPLVRAGDAARWPAEHAWEAVPASHEHAIVAHDGSERCIAWQNTLLDDDGQIALMAFGIDVTEQRAAAAATLQAREAAEAATRSKSEFLANMSHEIRTPMNAVIGMTRLALKTDLDARQRNYLEKADRAAHGLLGIINDILDFSKIEAGKLRFEQRPMLLRHVLDHLAALTVMKAQDKGLELLFDVAPDVPLEVVGDPLRLGQVLLNLVNNAIKFTERGEIIVAVRLAGRGEGDVELRFEVRDTGIGIAPEQAGRLFGAFVQADASTTRTHGGTGLGLSISRTLVEMMGGALSLASEPGVGSRFMFSARFGQPRAPQPQRTLARELGTVRALVVDDNGAAREILQGILESIDVRSSVAAGADAAIAELEAGETAGDPYQLVLMDWIMPSVDGLAAIRAIRANPAISETLSIIMVTAYNRDELLALASDLPELSVLEKPVTPSSVFDAIASACSSISLAAREAVVSPQAVTAALVTLRGAHVLLVEDNDVNRELAVDILTGLGLRVSVAGNGSVALAMIEQERYDALLMDCQMPVMDGFEATALIRRQPRFASLPIVAMTANAMTGDRERCLAAGMNEYVSKPIDADVLATVLAQWIAAPEQRGDAAPMSAAAPRLDALRGAGFALDGALARLHGNVDAYLTLLNQFRAAQGAVSAELHAALAAGQVERARRLAHNLEGQATNLGALVLADAAGRVRAVIDTGEGAELALAQLAAPLSAVLAAAAQSADTNPSAAA